MGSKKTVQYDKDVMQTFSDCEAERVEYLSRVELWEKYPELYEEIPIVQRVGRKSQYRDKFEIYQVIVDGKTYTALSLPLLRKKLEDDACYAFFEATEVSNKFRGERLAITSSLNHMVWLWAFRDGDFVDKRGNIVHVENGKIQPHAMMA